MWFHFTYDPVKKRATFCKAMAFKPYEDPKTKTFEACYEEHKGPQTG